MRHRRTTMWLALLVGTTAIAFGTSVRADVQPGDLITKDNADKVKDLVSPGVQWCVKHGMKMKIVPY